MAIDDLEFNQVLLEGERQTVSLMARKGEVTALTGEDGGELEKYLLAIVGFTPILSGHICIDAEPLTPSSVSFFRQQVAFAPSSLHQEGEIVAYDPPTMQELFSLGANRDRQVSSEHLDDETIRFGAENSDDRQTQLIAAASLLGNPVLLIANPPAAAMPSLRETAASGRIVLLTTHDPQVLAAVDKIVEI